MTEEEWLTEDNPLHLLLALDWKPNERKIRLFACACCRLIWSLVDDPNARNAVETAERFVDGDAELRQLNAAHKEVATARTAANRASLMTADRVFTPVSAARSIIFALDAVTMSASNLEAVSATETQRQLRLFHDIFRNPFRPITFSPTWRTSDVLLLAQGIYNERAFDRMPILADALQDAGCDNTDILDHCRDTSTPHARGCWVVDLVLGKS
jgi:hypothetical protein